MIVRIAAYLLIFYLGQIICQLLLKWGSTAPSRSLLGLLSGNLVGASSTWFLILVYRVMNPNVALGLSYGGAFLCMQLALAYVFKSRITPMQWAGIVTITVGMVALAMGGTEHAGSG